MEEEEEENEGGKEKEKKTLLNAEKGIRNLLRHQLRSLGERYRCRVVLLGRSISLWRMIDSLDCCGSR